MRSAPLLERSDADLLAAHRGGDPAAFRILYERYADRVFATCARIVGDAHEAADAVQEIFLTIHREAATYRGEAAVGTWLFRIATNAAIDRARAFDRRRGVSLPDEDALDSPRLGAGIEAPEMLVAKAELRGLVQGAIGRLSPKLRAIIILRYIEGFSYEEIAQILDASLGTVKSRLCRAHESLAAALGPVAG